MPASDTHPLREIHRRLFAQDIPNQPPEISEPLLQWLEDVFPPRCYTGSGETIEDHLMYAGQVSLIQKLRAIQTERLATEAADAPLTEEELEHLRGAGDGQTTIHQT